MQYFKNTPRRASEYPGTRNAGMFPLCRNDAAPHVGFMRDVPNDRGHICAMHNEPGADRTCTGGIASDHIRPCGDASPAPRCENTARFENEKYQGLAMAFVPDHEFDDLNDCEEALSRGSLFKKLDMPFYGQKRRGCK